MMREAAKEPERLKELFEQAAARLEILGPGEGESVIMVNDGSSGIEVGLSHRDGAFGYELKVPLGDGAEGAYVLGSDMSRPVSIGFETPEVDVEALRESMGGDMPWGGGGRGGGMGPGGMPGGGMRGGGRPEPLEIWARVTLASRIDQVE
jgi:hypothetical protein